jgi:hypothetical protein
MLLFGHTFTTAGTPTPHTLENSVDVGVLCQPHAGTIGDIRAPDRPRGDVPGADVGHPPWPKAIDDSRADTIVVEESSPGLDPLRPDGIVFESPAPMQQHDEGKRARACGAVQRDRQYPLRRLRAMLFDRAHLKARGVPARQGTRTLCPVEAHAARNAVLSIPASMKRSTLARAQGRALPVMLFLENLIRAR